MDRRSLVPGATSTLTPLEKMSSQAPSLGGREGTGYLIKGRLRRDSSFEASQLHLPTEKFGPSENDGE
ncbi:MAG: hypothetical protein RJA48_1955 [Verrucomicrobiota bacterium]